MATVAEGKRLKVSNSEGLPSYATSEFIGVMHKGFWPCLVITPVQTLTCNLQPTVAGNVQVRRANRTNLSPSLENTSPYTVSHDKVK